ncbi:MAG TPA: hypothetical protein DEQ38_10445 [Elusimicrobia bacterium]|nr:MAG: hypothetical protein A2089_11795 [Elusimicrobia bacterium GWD2_63_28]HCC48515.1 hypothetical protein [Elusimicrobiota bacterium]
MKRLALIAALLLGAGTLAAYRPYSQGARSKAAWMTVSAIKTGQEYYLEVAQDGRAVMRTETPLSLVTRRGTIKSVLVKDFFREIENSEIVNSQNVKQSKMVFYRGDMMKISAYISGELTRTVAPLNNFGEAFAYAFGEVKKAVAALPEETAVRAFLRAEPVEGEELDSFRGKAAVDGEVKPIETTDLQKIKPLMAAIKEPHRLIPIENEASMKELQDFISARQLYGLRTLFYVPSTRGTYKCQVLEITRKQAAPAPKKPVPARKPAPKKKR